MISQGLLVVHIAIASLFGVAPEATIQHEIKTLCADPKAQDGLYIMENIPKLVEVSGGDRVVLLQQLVFFLHESLPMAKTSYDYSIARGVAQFAEFTSEETLKAVVPLLDLEDPDFLLMAEKMLNGIDDRFEGSNPAVNPVMAYESIYTENNTIPRGLTRSLYKRYPNETFRFLIERSKMKPAEKLQYLESADMLGKLYAAKGAVRLNEDLQNERDRLNQLTRHKEWWVRLYAVELMIQDPLLATPGVVSIAQSEKDSLIATRAAAFKSIRPDIVGDSQKQLEALKTIKRTSGPEFEFALSLYLSDLDQGKYDELMTLYKTRNHFSILDGIGMKLSRRAEKGQTDLIDGYIESLHARLVAGSKTDRMRWHSVSGLGKLINVGPMSKSTEGDRLPYAYDKVYAILDTAVDSGDQGVRQQSILQLGYIAERYPSQSAIVLERLLARKSKMADQKVSGKSMSTNEKKALEEAITRAK